MTAMRATRTTAQSIAQGEAESSATSSSEEAFSFDVCVQELIRSLAIVAVRDISKVQTATQPKMCGARSAPRRLHR